MAGTTNGGINQKPQKPSNNKYGFVSSTGPATQAVEDWENKVTGETFQANSGGYTNPDPNWTRVNRLASSLITSGGPSNRILGADPVRDLSLITDTGPQRTRDFTSDSSGMPMLRVGRPQNNMGYIGSQPNMDIKAQAPMPPELIISNAGWPQPTNGQSFADYIKTNGANGKGGDLPFGNTETTRGPQPNMGYRGPQPNMNIKAPAYNPTRTAMPFTQQERRRPLIPQNMTESNLNSGVQQMAAPSAGGYNVNTASAQGLQKAQQGAASEMGYRPMQVNPAMVSQRGYNPATMAGVGDITADNVSGRGYDAATMGDVRTVSADNVNAGQLAGSDLSAYTNPYETQVVDQALGDIERQRLMAQNVGSAQAGAANAFGGSRQGIAEAETNRAYMEQAAKTASGLRQAGYMNAQEQSGQDIARRMQASLANQQANMQAGQFNAGTDLSRQQANQSAFNQAGQFGASAFNQGNLANQSANMQAQQASAANALAAQQANQAARNNAGQFGANAFNQAGQMNQSAIMQARLANQNAGLSGSQQRLSAGQQLGSLSNLGFGMGQQIQGRMDQQGAAQQNLQQQIINAARSQYGGFTGAPQQSLQALLAAVGGAPAVGSQTKGYTPGLFDYLSLGAGMAR